MSPDDGRRETEDLAERPNLVLEEIPKRLDEFEAEFLGKAADVVMKFDVRGGSRQGMAVRSLFTPATAWL